MFPGHPAALNAPLLNLSFLQYGIVDILKEEFLKDIEGVPSLSSLMKRRRFKQRSSTMPTSLTGQGNTMKW